MTFASLSFAVFFPIALLGYYVLPTRFRWAWLLAASCAFYMAFIPLYILILFVLIIVDYFAAIQIEKSSGKRRHVFFMASILSNIGMLFVFKYFNFFSENITLLAQALHWNYSAGILHLILPLGLSFHTFQSLSYVIEVYKGNYKPERHLGIYALYVLFFPQLIAGPIERPMHLLPQLKTPIKFDRGTFISGLRLMGWGFFKKLVIADRLGISVNYVWANLAQLSGFSVFAAIVFFAFQLYADFSGYSDIARGSARTLGIDVMQNFRQPYFSKSVSEFWRRWHISLSSWFRDYIYIPMGGNRVGPWRRYFNVLTVFAVMGFWHGAGWTYPIMGLLFGAFQSIGLATMTIREKIVNFIGLSYVPRLHRILQMLITFSLVSFAWIFFRAPSLSDAVQFLGVLSKGWQIPTYASTWAFVQNPYGALGFGRPELILTIIAIATLLIVEHFQTRRPLTTWFLSQKPFVKGFIYTTAILSVLVFGEIATGQFIYFQF